MKPEMFTPLDEVLDGCIKKMIEDFNSRLLDEGSDVGGLLEVLQGFDFVDLLTEYGGPLFEAAEKQMVYQMACEVRGVTCMIISDNANSVTSVPGIEETDQNDITMDELEPVNENNQNNRNNTSKGITNTHIISCN